MTLARLLLAACLPLSACAGHAGTTSTGGGDPGPDDDGSITSLHYADLHNDDSANYWETRSARRLLFVHAGPAGGHLFMGGNHGVTHVLADGWGDHVHVEAIDPTGSLLVGEWYGLA